MRILTYTPTTFAQRVSPLLDTLAYAVLTDRTGGGEDRLAEWPPAKGPLPSDDPDANIAELWRWVNHTLDDALMERPGQGTFRLSLYGPKGMDTLARLTIRAESDVDEEADEDQAFDIPPDPAPLAPRELAPADRLERAVDLHERAVQMMLNGGDRMLRQSQAVNAQVLRTLKGTSDAFQEQLAQLFAHVKDLRQMVQDVIEVLVAERLTASEQQAESIVESARGKGKASKEPNPLVAEALKETMGGLRDWLLNGRDMPGAAKALLEHPKAKELLTNPKLAERLKKNPELLDQLMDFISASINDASGEAPPRGTYDLPEE